MIRGGFYSWVLDDGLCRRRPVGGVVAGGSVILGEVVGLYEVGAADGLCGNGAAANRWVGLVLCHTNIFWLAVLK